MFNRLVASVLLALMLVAALYASQAHARGSFYSGRSYPSSRPFSRPAPIQRAPVTIHRNTTIIHQSAPSVGGGWFAPFAGALGGSWLGSWLNKPTPPQTETPLPLCSTPNLPANTACSSTTPGVH